MAAFTINTAVLGGGSVGAKNALRVNFPNAPLAAIPILQAFSTTGATPVANQGANEDHVFYNDTDSCVYAITTDDKATKTDLNDWASALTDLSANKFGTSPAFNANGRKLNGNVSYLQLAPDSDDRIAPSGVPTNNVSFYFNVAFRAGTLTQTSPSTANVFYLGVQYIYTGATDPTVIWQGNSGATDEAPTWSSIAGADAAFPGVPERVMIHANAGSNPANPVLTKPTTGKVFSKLIAIQAP